jgi:putative Ca2+/H+ antiporter (TMEM165/GDT1 family)
MKKIPCIVALLLGVAFIIFGVSHFVPAVKSDKSARTTRRNGRKGGFRLFQRRCVVGFSRTE